MAAPAPEGSRIAAETLTLAFRWTALGARRRRPDRRPVAEGRVKAVTPRGETVIVAAGETFEAAKGEPTGAPAAADMKRLNPWWESIR
jgi:hypothetical protein